jgi:hypothetical protein
MQCSVLLPKRKHNFYRKDANTTKKRSLGNVLRAELKKTGEDIIWVTSFMFRKCFYGEVSVIICPMIA